MELKAGYKQTEVGVIPEDWEVRPLRKISPKQSVGLVINPSSYFDANGTVPMLVGSNVTPNKIDWEQSNRITSEKNREIPASRVFSGDLVTVRVGAPGITAVIPEEIDGCNCASMMIVRGHASFDSNWLCAIMNSNIGLNQIEFVQYGTAQKQFNISDALNFVYPVPKLAEQQAIASALSDADALIESLEQLLAKKRQIKQGAMQELLTGKRRLPGFEGEWVTKQFNEISWFQEGPGVRAWQFTASGIKLLNGTNISRGSLYLECTSRFISEAEAYGAYAHFMADIGDIVIASSGITVERFHEKVAYVRESDLPFCMNTSTIRFKPKYGVLTTDYLFHLLASDDFKSSIGGQATGSAQLNFGPSHVAKVSVCLPDCSEQTAIASILSDMDAELTTLETQLQKTRQLKQGMMQELLTGRIRLV